MKKIVTCILSAMLIVAPMSSCVSTSEGHSIQALEAMSELDYNKWQLYIQLGTKISANRLLSEGVLSVEELEKAAVALETVRDQTGTPLTKSFIKDALKDSGLTNDELELVLVVVEQELIARGALQWLNPVTGVVELSPRAKQMLTIVADALRSATTVTEEEMRQGMQLESQFNAKLL